jgi:hypothetical protein
MGQGHRYYEEKTRRIPVQGLGHLYKINTIYGCQFIFRSLRLGINVKGGLVAIWINDNMERLHHLKYASRIILNC